MKFLCLVIVDNDLSDRMQPEDWAQMGAESQSYDKSLMQRGVFIHAEALEGLKTARTVRGGQAMATDGPFIESKEAVAGFILIDVEDADAALEIAKNIPMARLGAVEVRPVMNF